MTTMNDLASRVVARAVSRVAGDMALQPEAIKVQVKLTRGSRMGSGYMVSGILTFDSNLTRLPALEFSFTVDKTALGDDTPPNIQMKRIPRWGEYIEHCLIEDWDRVVEFLSAV